MGVRKEMLTHLKTGRPTVIAGDINTSEFVMRHWMQTAGVAFSPSLACSGATPVLHGDYTIATTVFMWQAEHQVGKSFEADDAMPVDCVSDTHDMVCVVLSCVPQRNPITTDVAELGGRPEGEASSSEGPTTADVAELGGATDSVARPQEERSSSEDPTAADAAELFVLP